MSVKTKESNAEKTKDSGAGADRSDLILNFYAT